MHSAIDRRRSRIALLIIGSLGLGYGLWVLWTTSALPFIGGGYEVRAVLPQTANLIGGARVTSAGIEVGRVTSVSRQGMGAVVTMEIVDDTVTPLPRDTLVRLRQRTPVGENFVEVVPGKSKTTLPSGRVLPLEQPDDFVELDQVLSSLSGPTQQRTRQLLRSLGASLDGRGDELNDLLANTSGVVNHLATMADIGARNDRRIKSLIRSAGRISNAIGERQAAIESVATRGLTTVRAIGARDRSLRKLLRVLPSTLDQVRTSVATLTDLSTSGSPVVDELADGVTELRPTVERLPAASRVGRELVSQLDRTISPLRGTLAGVRKLSGPTVAAAPKLRRTLCELNPMLRYIGRYRLDIASSIANMQSSVHSYDALGHLARVSMVTGENAIAALPAELSRSMLALAHSGILSSTQGLELDPYPRPGEVGRRGLPSKPALTPEDLAARPSSKFERIHPDC